MSSSNKDVLAYFWAFIGTFPIWLFSLPLSLKKDFGPTDLIFSHLTFTVLFISSGYVFSVFTKIISIPYLEKDKKLWKKLRASTLAPFITIIAFDLFVYAAPKSSPTAILLLFFFILVVTVFIIWYANKKVTPLLNKITKS